jgi:hypothetical protein
MPVCDLGQNYTQSKIWLICAAACILGLWKTRNNRVFNNKNTTRPDILRMIADDLQLWACRSEKLKAKMFE